LTRREGSIRKKVEGGDEQQKEGYQTSTSEMQSYGDRQKERGAASLQKDAKIREGIEEIKEVFN